MNYFVVTALLLVALAYTVSSAPKDVPQSDLLDLEDSDFEKELHNALQEVERRVMEFEQLDDMPELASSEEERRKKKQKFYKKVLKGALKSLVKHYLF
uniref:Peu 1a n=1 Tax=Peucetia striata TaxID=2066576 RepID=A0A8D7ZUK7_9ARAC|nr:Peu 1a precursor [Peucetia striata]